MMLLPLSFMASFACEGDQFSVVNGLTISFLRSVKYRTKASAASCKFCPSKHTQFGEKMDIKQYLMVSNFQL